MATTEQRFEHLSFRAGAADAGLPPAAAGARHRLLMVLAGVAALVAWGLFDQSSDQRSGADRHGPSAAIADQQQVYDGRGKWGGYLPQGRSHSQTLQDAGALTDR